jgi:hypothetical protein
MTLGRYRSRLHALIQALAQAKPGFVHSNTYNALEELSQALEVDLEVRRSDPGRERMTRLEAEVLVPLLSDLHRDLARLLRERPSNAWLATLHGADQRVAAVERSLAEP